jgi:AcrR family transcriptional regulator
MKQISAARRERRDTLETRRQIVDAAEMLFAEHGVDNVTLLDIARAADQKNRNAAQYHFGDKAGLINAVLDKHSDLISARRKTMVDALREKRSPSLREMVEAYVLPVAMHVDSTPNSVTYLLLHSQLMTSDSFAGLTQERIDRYPEVQQLRKMMLPIIVATDRAEREAKILLIQTLVFHGLAGFYASGSRNSRRFIEILCNSVEAVLAN